MSVFLAHDLLSFRDTAETLRRLRQTEASCCDVAEYWRTVDPSDRDATQWSASEVLDAGVRYVGPGSIGLTITSRAARIDTGGRWRGLLSIDPLRRVHLAAFRSIAAALGTESIAICHDSNEHVQEIFWAGGTQGECVSALHAAYGPPQPSIDVIEPRIVEMTDHGVPDVWYFDHIQKVRS